MPARSYTELMRVLNDSDDPVDIAPPRPILSSRIAGRTVRHPSFYDGPVAQGAVNGLGFLGVRVDDPLDATLAALGLVVEEG